MPSKPKTAVQKDEPLEKKHEHADKCKQGFHTYIVTTWQVGGGKEKAIAMRCQGCLMPLDLQEIESAEWSAKQDELK